MSRQVRKKKPEHRLVVIGKRRRPTEDGLARLVAAMVLHRLHTHETAQADRSEGAQ